VCGAVSISPGTSPQAIGMGRAEKEEEKEEDEEEREVKEGTEKKID
jgi:hypothetical protein